MSRMPYLFDAADARWGHRLGHFQLVDAMYRDGFRCSLCDLLMGETAEILAREYGIGRAESDEFALASQEKTARALAEGAFATRCPRRGRRREGGSDRGRRLHPLRSTREGLAKLSAVFEIDGLPGIITPGELVWHYGRRRGRRSGEHRCGRAARARAARARHGVGERRGESAAHGDRSGARSEGSPRAALLPPRSI